MHPFRFNTFSRAPKKIFLLIYLFEDFTSTRNLVDRDGRVAPSCRMSSKRISIDLEKVIYQSFEPYVGGFRENEHERFDSIHGKNERFLMNARLERLDLKNKTKFKKN